MGPGRLHGTDPIGVRVGKVVNKYKVAKHFKLDIDDDRFDFEIDPDKVAAEAALDGIYVVRTSLPAQRMSADDTVRSCKLLGQVERAFRSLKTLDLQVRPLRHRLEDRVRAHLFLCSPTTSSGTCSRHGARCCSVTRTRRPSRRVTQ